MPFWQALVCLQPTPGRLLVALCVIWVADTAAYFVGRRFGRRKLAPTISPGKTWEGVWGALGAVAVYWMAIWSLVPEHQRAPAVRAGVGDGDHAARHRG